MTGDDTKLHKAFQRAVMDQEKVERKFNEMKKAADAAAKSADKTGDALKGAGKKGDQAFGTEIIGKLQSYATIMGGVQLAVQAVTGSMAKMRADTDAAVQSIERLRDQRKEMSQMATDPKDYQKLKGGAERLSTKYGLSQEEGHALQTAARAGGFEKNLDQVALAAATFAKTEDLIPTAASLPTIFEGLTPEQALNLTAAGGTAAKNMTFKGVAEQLRIGAQGGRQAGSSPQETAALVTIMSDLFNTSTGDRIRAFGGKVGQSDMKGLGIMGAMDKLQGMDEKGRKAFLGDSAELNAVYSFLSERGGDVRSMEKQLSASMAASGTANSPLNVGAQAYFADKENRALFDRDVQKRKRELTEQKELGVTGLNNEAAKDIVRTSLSKRNSSFLRRWAAEGAMAASEWMPGGNNPQAIATAGVGGARNVGLGAFGIGLNSAEDAAVITEAGGNKAIAEDMRKAAAELYGAAYDLRDSTKNKTNAARRETVVNRPE